jgi:iron complex outermembrane receptor protein
MMNRKRVFWASTALFTGMLLAGAASAQSTGTEATEVEQVVVTGARVRQVDGLAVAQQVGKSRSTVTQEYLSTQTPGNTPLAMLNLQPGVNFTNNDPFGASGGDITIRGFDSQRISLNLDGIQLNDTGNYAIYSNQQPDPETLERVSINQGTTDVDSPTASATGGTINFQTRRPANEFGAIIQPSFGSLNYQRIFALVDTGVVGPWAPRPGSPTPR